nr:hypothetical protein [Rhizobium sp. ACO-34A]
MDILWGGPAHARRQPVPYNPQFIWGQFGMTLQDIRFKLVAHCTHILQRDHFFAGISRRSRRVWFASPRIDVRRSNTRQATGWRKHTRCAGLAQVDGPQGCIFATGNAPA